MNLGNSWPQRSFFRYKQINSFSVKTCPIDKGLIKDENGDCVCPPRHALNEKDECVRCLPELGQKIDERGRCVCDLEKGMVIDEHGNCVCPTEHGYRLNYKGECVLRKYPIHSLRRKLRKLLRWSTY